MITDAGMCSQCGMSTLARVDTVCRYCRLLAWMLGSRPPIDVTPVVRNPPLIDGPPAPPPQTVQRDDPAPDRLLDSYDPEPE